MKLRRISKQGWALTNCCQYQTKDGNPMVGSTFCMSNCPHYKGTIRLLFWKFVKYGIDNYFAVIVLANNGFYRFTHKKPNSTVLGISHGNWEELDEDDMKFFEVIGNIHDNPELLKGGAE